METDSETGVVMLEKVNERLAEYERTLAFLRGQTAAGGQQLITRKRRQEIAQLESKISAMRKAVAAFEEKFCEEFPALPPVREAAKPPAKSKPAPARGGASQSGALGCVILLLIAVLLAFVAIVVLYNQNVGAP